MNGGKVPMEPTTWPGMRGNGSQTGMTRIITGTVHQRILKGHHRAVSTNSFGAVPGTLIRQLYDPRTGSGNVRSLGMRLSGFVVPNPLLSRIWELRENLTAYDAVYVALAEVLNITMVTCDANVAAASGHSAHVILV